MASIIEKGTPAHNAHIEGLKASAKDGDKDAAANLKQYEVKKSEVKKDEDKKDK